MILGVTIQTDGGTVFRDRTGAVTDAVEFFDQAEDRLVDADGTEQ